MLELPEIIDNGTELKLELEITTTNKNIIVKIVRDISG
jgi:hypothetical protein